MKKKKLLVTIASFQFILYFLAVLFNPSGPQWAEKSYDVSEMSMSNPVNQIVYSFIFVLAAVTIIPHYKKFIAWLNTEKFIIIFLIWCGITIVFAIDSFVSFKRYFQYVTTSLVFISFYLNSSDENNLIKILKNLFSIYAILTVIACVILPDAKDPSFNTWRGFHATKNNLGQYASILIIFFSYYFLYSNSRINKIYSASFILISFFLLFGSFSMTNIVLICVFFSVFLVTSSQKIFSPIGLGIKTYFFFIIVLALLFLVIIISFPTLISYFFEITGKDPTLTGRTEIWALVLAQNINDLITGVGFQSFWIPEKLSKIILFQYWMPNQSHNGYVDIILEIGIIGLVLFILVQYSFFRNAKLYSNNLLWIILTIYVLFLNLSESTLIRPHHFTNVMLYCSFWTVSYKRFSMETNYYG